ncbi:MAG TPA: hypothetical protein VIF14_07765 [Alphaproteobacteria bacterium]|jgi:hypothetical protein
MGSAKLDRPGVLSASGSPAVAGAGGEAVPFGLAEALRAPATWRARFAWPIAAQTVFDLATRLLSRSVDLLIATAEPARSVLLLGRSFNRAAALIEAAAAVEAERALGLRLEGPRDLAVLRGERETDERAPSDTMLMAPPARKARFPRLRRIARTKSWTPWWRMPRALLRPEAIVVSHNRLLVSDAARQGAAVRYVPADPMLADCLGGAPAASLFASPEARAALVARTVEALSDEPLLGREMRARVKSLLAPIVAADLAAADSVLARLDRSPGLPGSIWSGSGGFYPARALGLAAMRRGGRVRRYDHGGTASLMADVNFLAQQELAVSTELVMPTARAGAAIAGAARRLGTVPAAAISGSSGDPSLDPGRAWRRSSVPSRRRVIYVASAYYGFSQTFPPFPPSVVYIDWQHRLLEALARLPIELHHKPHPGGLLRGNPRMLAHLAPILTRRFEDELGGADVVVIDIAATTTLAIAMCSDRPVVLLDMGCMPFNEPVRAEIVRRCRIVPVVSDARNRLAVDAQALGEAVCGGPDRADPSFFREFFLGA